MVRLICGLLSCSKEDHQPPPSLGQPPRVLGGVGEGGMISWAGSSDTMCLNEGEDVLLGQFLRILALLRVVYSDTITPLPEEPPIVADAGGIEERRERSSGWA